MATELALGLVGPAIEVVKLVGRPIVRQFNYLCCFTSNINSLKEEFQKLNDDWEDLDGEVQTAKQNVQEPVARVKTWLTKSNNLKVEINEILTQSTNVESGCSKLVARFSLSKKAKKTTDLTKALRDEKPKAEFQEGPIAATQGVQLGKAFECESRNKIEEEIVTTLIGGDVHKIGICGMGGLGKTTMAKKIMNRVLEKVFAEVVMATVSQNVVISKIQDEIGVQLGLEKLKDEKLHEIERKQILHSRLNDTKRTLLVLDDIWEEPPLESIGIPFDSKWCTIIFTSRNRDVLRKLKVQIFGMKVLSEKEAWSFFSERAGTCVQDRELNPIAKKVAKECGGLPINLAAVAVGLNDERDAAIWKDTLRKLEESVPANVRYDKVSYNPLKWSYDRLESTEAQSVFLLCCLFPEDADIPLYYLTYISMGLRISKGIKNMEAARNSMRKLIKDLKDRSLVLDDGQENSVRMHDVIRDVCTLIAKEEGCIANEEVFTGKWISSSHLVDESYKLLSGSRCPNLRLLFLDSRYDSLGFKLDDAFVEGMRELHVLCIQAYDSLTTLPSPMQSLRNLNTLILHSCTELKTISFVGELVNLEILICCYSRLIKELPLEMKGLNRLKLLNLTGCKNLQSIGRGIIASLVGLEELNMLWSFNEWNEEDREGRENASLEELEALPNLTCLEIDIRDPSLASKNLPHLSKKIVRFIINNQSNGSFESEFSKAMRLTLWEETRLGDWIEMQLLKDTEHLRLGGGGAKYVDLAKLQNLRWLELGPCDMKNIVTTSGGDIDGATVFPFIEYLNLEYISKLEEIYDGPISSTSFQYLNKLKLHSLGVLTQFWKSSSVPQNNNVPHFTNLSSIYIRECDSLRNLGQLSMAGKDCLPQLEKLDIWHCPMMEQVFLWNDEEVITKVFPKLKEVVLHNLPNLTTFYQGVKAIEFPLLRVMRIERCPKISDDSLLLLNRQPQN